MQVLLHLPARYRLAAVLAGRVEGSNRPLGCPAPVALGQQLAALWAAPWMADVGLWSLVSKEMTTIARCTLSMPSPLSRTSRLRRSIVG